MKRTSKRISEKLNLEKFELVRFTARAYAEQKDEFLVTYSQIRFYDRLCNNSIRDELVKSKFKSKYGLKARMWKNSLKDALQTLDMYWAAILVDVRLYIYRNENLTPEEKKIALKNYKSVKDLFEYKLPVSKKIRNYLTRKIRNVAGKRPRVKLHRGIGLDANMYRVFEESKRQYISIMTLKKPVVIPLKGKQTISGNIRLILGQERTIGVHVMSDVGAPVTASGEEQGIDWGMSEIFTDSDGKHWGDQFFGQLKDYADKVNTKGIARNKLYAIARNTKNLKKAANIKKFNLGKIKLRASRTRIRAMMENGINREMNTFFKEKSPSEIGVEDLSFYKPPFGEGRFSRQSSIWMRNTIKSRLTFKAAIGGSDLTDVNAAYGSQTCSRCGYVDARNRKGDKFQCLRCGMMLNADHNAALIYKARLYDTEIKLWYRPKQVKAILLRRLEGSSSHGSTVSGKTPDKISSTKSCRRAKAKV